MIESLLPSTRILLVQCRCIAMGGDIDTAIGLLDGAMRSYHATPLDSVSVALLKAELLHLDNKPDGARIVFEEQIRPLLSELPEEIQLVLERNENDVKTATFQPGSTEELYLLVDRQRLLGFEPSDLRAILAAEDDAAAEKHHSAFAAFWRELVRAYHRAYWRPVCWAASRLAREYVRLGLYHEAAYHAVIGDDRELARKIGDRLIEARNRDGIRLVVESLLATSNLQHHFIIGCEIVGAFADGLSEAEVNSVFRWLMLRCSIDPLNLGEMTTVGAAWTSLLSFAERLNSDQASLVLHTAINHRIWRTGHTQREQMIRVVTRCLPKLRPRDLSLAATLALPTVKEAKSNFDYREAVNLLCHIAQLGSVKLRNRLAKALYSKTGPVDMILVEAGPVFGKRMRSPKRWDSVIEKSAKHIRLQVQRLRPEQQAEKMFGTFGTFTHSDPDGNPVLVVNVASAADLSAYTAHRHSIPPARLEHLAEAALDMIQERENLFSNRILLIGWLAEVADRLPMKSVRGIVRLLVPIARGAIEEPVAMMPWMDADNPLSSFRFKGGTPTELRGTAIWALATLQEARPRLREKEIETLLELGQMSVFSSIGPPLIRSIPPGGSVTPSRIA